MNGFALGRVLGASCATIIFMALPQSLRLNVPQRLRISYPFALALGALLVLGWSISLAIRQPYDGILLYSNLGIIQEIDPFGPAAGKLKPGDLIISIDGIPQASVFNIHENLSVGDNSQFVINRNGELSTVAIKLLAPPYREFFRRIMPLLVGLIFWIIGAGVLVFSPVDRTAEFFFLFCQASSLLLITGFASSAGPAWTSSVFNFLLWMIGPLTVHFHLHFPQTVHMKYRSVLLFCLYGLAAIGGVPYLIWGSPQLFSSLWYPLFLTGSRLFLALNLVITALLLIYSYRLDSPGARGKIRLVVLGGVISALPIATLTILPDILLGQPILPYTFAFLLLCIIPLTYGYAIIRHRLVVIDKHVNRGASYILVFSSLGAFYLVLYSALHRWLPVSMSEGPLVNTVLALILASVFVPLSQRIQKIVDKVFYGGWYDYRSAVNGITDGLEQVTDLEALAETINRRLFRTLRLQESCLYLREVDGNYSVIAVAPQSKPSGSNSRNYPILPKNSLAFLSKYEMVERESIRRALGEVTISNEERQLLESPQIQRWAPITGHGQVLGMLGLGSKVGGDVFSVEDMDIIRVVALQASSLIENIHLVTRLKRHADYLEKRVAERTVELFAAKEHVEAILKSVGDGVVVTDLEWNVVNVNPAFEEQSGFPAQEILQQKFWSFINFEESRGLLDHIKIVLQNGSIWTGELTSIRKDGRTYNVQLTLSPVWNENHQVTGYVGSQRDITRQKELDRLKDRLIFDVSHELRTPVTNLNLYVELLERGQPTRQAEYLEVLKSETNQLRSLIESILDLSRLDIWKSRKLALAPVNLNLVTEQVVSAHRPLAENSGLGLIYEPGSDLPLVKGEQNQLARLISNLLSNSIRYTSSGQVFVRTFGENGRVCLQVTDSGIGIDSEDLPHIFDRFYRGRQVSQSRINGSGLGLAIVKEIVEIHEGEIEVESEVSKGSTFRVWLPVYQKETETVLGETSFVLS